MTRAWHRHWSDTPKVNRPSTEEVGWGFCIYEMWFCLPLLFPLEIMLLYYRENYEFSFLAIHFQAKTWIKFSLNIKFRRPYYFALSIELFLKHESAKRLIHKKFAVHICSTKLSRRISLQTFARFACSSLSRVFRNFIILIMHMVEHPKKDPHNRSENMYKKCQLIGKKFQSWYQSKVLCYLLLYTPGLIL